MRLLCCCFFFVFGLTSFAQKDTLRKWLDADLHFTGKKDMVYPALAIRSGDHWMLVAVYPDTSILVKATYKDAALTVKDGPYSLYFPKQIEARSGSYRNNNPDGEWRFYYPGGQLKTRGVVSNNHLTGKWASWYANGQPMAEKQYIYEGSDALTHASPPIYNVQGVLDEFTPEGTLEGPALGWYENGQPESIVSYHRDSLTGNCSFFRENGQPSSKETYVHGKVTALSCYDEQGKYTGEACPVLKLPVFVHPFLSPEEFVEEELHKDKNRDIKTEGDAAVQFTVTKGGKVEDIKFISTPDPALSSHLIRILAAMPWSAAVSHNRKIDFPVKLNIPYYR